MMELENLKAALKWALENGAMHRNIIEGGCGCCAGEAIVPEELKTTIYEVLGWT